MNECQCPMCHADNLPMGSLGSLVWYRCQYCGWKYSIPEEEDDPQDESE